MQQRSILPKYLDTFQYEKGDHRVVISTIDGIPMLALGWQDRNMKKFLATCGTMVEGNPHKKKNDTVFQKMANHRSIVQNCEETQAC